MLAARKGVTVEAAESAEILCYGDEDLLRQMLLNLLDNAIRHTPAGGVVRVNLTQSDSTCEVIVSDTGEGIPVEAQPHIFERFYRVDKARSRSNSGANGANGGGAGLGLSIARWIAEAHNGTIRLAHSARRALLSPSSCRSNEPDPGRIFFDVFILCSSSIG